MNVLSHFHIAPGAPTMARSTNSFLLGMLTGGGLLLAGLLLGGMNQSAPADGATADVLDVVRARRVEIVDDIGTVRAALGSNTNGGTLSVRDKLGRTVLLSSASDTGGVLVINNTASQHPAFMAGAEADGGAMHVFSDQGIRVVEASGRAHGRFTVTNERGVPQVRLDGERAGRIVGFDRAGRPVYQLSMGDRGSGTVQTMQGESGVTLVTLGATVDDQGLVRTASPNGKPLVLLTSSPRREGQIYTWNDAGNPLVALATRVEGATVRIYNPKGEPAITLEPNAVESGSIGLWTADGSGRVLEP